MNKDSEGYYYQFGKSGARYYFNINSQRSMDIAYQKCLQQMSAIFAHNYKKY